MTRKFASVIIYIDVVARVPYYIEQCKTGNISLLQYAYMKICSDVWLLVYLYIEHMTIIALVDWHQFLRILSNTSRFYDQNPYAATLPNGFDDSEPQNVLRNPNLLSGTCTSIQWSKVYVER